MSEKLKNKTKSTDKTTKVIHVVWEDCIGDTSGWMDLKEFQDWANEELPVIHTVGFLVHEHDKFIVVAGSVSDDVDTLAEVQKIPRSQIHSVAIVMELPISFDDLV